MKVVGLSLLAALGCASVQPFVPSDQQRAQFDRVVQAAETATAADGPAAAAALVADAKSDFEYSQHLPMYPDRARDLAAKAQYEAEKALWMARQVRRRADLAAGQASDTGTVAGPRPVTIR